MKRNLLFEIGTEELPARFIEQAIGDLKILAENYLKNHELSYDDIITGGTCRRLVLFVKNLQERQKDREEEILGPSLQVALDREGNYTPALLGFAKKFNLSPEDLYIKDTPKGKYFCGKRIIPGKRTMDLLPNLLVDLMANINFPKRMRWAHYDYTFARPIRWILALFGEEVIPFELAGIFSSNYTFGHRFLSPNRLEIEKNDWDYYVDLLRKNFVIVDPNERLQETEQRIRIASHNLGYPLLEKDLLEENSNLVEFPFPVVGTFSEKFLALPSFLVKTALQEHQRYFMITDDKGNLLPYFVAVNNNKPRDESVVIKGHERVAKARLEDALFYYQRDREKPFSYFVEKLSGIVYHIRCGTLFEKTQRLIKIGEFLRGKLFPELPSDKVEKLLLYAKADLATEVVKEFPSLQGYVGSHYLALEGENEISTGILEQYLPSTREERYPETPYGIIVSLADKIDHLCALIGSGEKITGEGDPYALRRSANGILKILLEKGIYLPLEPIFEYALSLLKEANYLRNHQALQEVTEFVRKRLEGEFLSMGFSKNFVYVVIDQPLNPYMMYQKLLALKDIHVKKEFQDLSVLFKRVTQILKNVTADSLPKIDPDLFEFEEEKSLFQLLEQKRDFLFGLYQSMDFKAYLENLLPFKDLIDAFFDRVFVMVENEALRKNRLSLLNHLASYFHLFGDLSHLA